MTVADLELAVSAALDGTDPVEQLIAGFLLASRSPRTREARRLDLRHWFAWATEHQVDPLMATRGQCETYATWLVEHDGYAAATAARKLSTLTSWFGWLDRDPNPMARVRRPRAAADMTGVVLTADQLRATLTAARDVSARSYALVVVLSVCALRISEACALDVDDLVESNGQPFLMVEGKGHRGSRVPVPAPAMVVAALHPLRDGQPAGTPLFRARSGRRWSRQEAARAVRVTFRRAGLPHADRLGPHALRATAATLALLGDVSITRVQTWLRHANPATTARYLRAAHSYSANASHWLAGIVDDGSPAPSPNQG